MKETVEKKTTNLCEKLHKHLNQIVMTNPHTESNLHLTLQWNLNNTTT